MEEIKNGTQIWFPTAWECGTVDSILSGPGGKIIACVIKKQDGTKVAIDMQSIEQEEPEG